MGKLIVIGILIILVIVVTFAATEVIRDYYNKRVEAFAVFTICIVVFCIVMIFGGVGCF